MKKRLTLKDSQREIRLFTFHTILISIGIAFLSALLIARLAYLQLYHHKLYVTLSLQNQLNLAPIEPNRGLIFDRHGVLLAENIPVFSLEVLPNRGKHRNKNYYKQILSDIAKIIPLNSDDLEQFEKQRKRHRRFEAIPLRTRLTEEEVARLSVNQYRLPGVLIKTQLIRHYPLGQQMVAALGYVGRINLRELKTLDASDYSATNFIGKIGIEKYYESELHGTVGYQHVEMDASGRIIRILKSIPPVPGNNLYLTLDSQLQSVALQAFGTLRGALVAIEPKTGQILALVSNPTYDPNLFVDGISRKNFHALRSDSTQPLYNRSLRGQYPLGSTIKPFMGLAALDGGIVNATYRIFDPGWFQLDNSTHIYHDWQRRGHGWVDLTTAIVHSCDTYFYNLAHKMGIARIDTMMDHFGFGKQTGIDIQEELPGLVPSPDWKKRHQGKSWYPGDTLISGIGQGFMLATPLQLAAATATIANRGVRFQPSLLLAQQTPKNLTTQHQPTVLEPVRLRDSTWELIINAMHGVITEGTGGPHFGRDAPYTVAAKTGTAQVFSLKKNEKYNRNLLPENLRDHSLFIAFSPIENPQIALAVIVENSDEAGSIARKVMDYYLLQEKKLVPTKADIQPVPANAHAQ